MLLFVQSFDFLSILFLGFFCFFIYKISTKKNAIVEEPGFRGIAGTIKFQGGGDDDVPSTYLQVDNNKVYTGVSSFTIETFVKLDTVDIPTKQTIFVLENTIPSVPNDVLIGISVEIVAINQEEKQTYVTLTYKDDTDTKTSSFAQDTEEDLFDSQWHHVAVTYNNNSPNQTPEKISVFIDGVLSFYEIVSRPFDVENLSDLYLNIGSSPQQSEEDFNQVNLKGELTNFRVSAEVLYPTDFSVPQVPFQNVPGETRLLLLADSEEELFSDSSDNPATVATFGTVNDISFLADVGIENSKWGPYFPPFDPECDVEETYCYDNNPPTCANLNTDSNNCGQCGTTCNEGRLCQQGVCTLDIDFNTDNDNCGSLGNVCNTAETRCLEGSCIDILGDNNNCGDIGTVCDSLGNNTCCNGLCTNLITDGENCGSCGNVCIANSSCSNSSCVCDEGLTLCGNICADLLVTQNLFCCDGVVTYTYYNDDHCGSCTPCDTQNGWSCIDVECRAGVGG